MSKGRYYSIKLEPDSFAGDDTHQLVFTTMPGMSTAIGSLQEGDLYALIVQLEDYRASLRGKPAASYEAPASDQNQLGCALCGEPKAVHDTFSNITHAFKRP